MMVIRKSHIIWVLLIYLTSMAPVYAQAQSPAATTRVSIGDVLSIAVPQRPQLNRELVVGSNGTITYPLVGDIFVNGLTLAEAERQILQVLRDVYPSVTNIELKTAKAGKITIYVAGAVGNPGKVAFTEPPNLWDAIREAGGPSGTAALDAVRVVGDSKRGGQSTVVDVQRALDSGTVEQLPKLQDGDSVVIPARTEQGQGQGGGANAVDVYGSVVHPGTFRVPEGSTVVEALLMAGGTLPEAKMAKISIVRGMGDGTNNTIAVDVRKFLDSGDPLSNPVVRPGDTIYVPRQNAFLWALKNDAGVVIGLIGSAITLGLVLSNQN